MSKSRVGLAFAAAAVGGVMLLGAPGSASADHRPSIDVQISTPGLYTRFATGQHWGYGPYYGGGYYAPPPPVYVPGYWTYHPPRVYWSGPDYRHEHRPRHHERHDRGRHNGWRKNRNR